MRVRSVVVGIALVAAALLSPLGIERLFALPFCAGFYGGLFGNGGLSCGDTGPAPAQATGLLHAAADVAVPGGTVDDLELVDVNGDGALDALVVIGAGIHVMLGDGHGGFGTPAGYDSGVARGLSGSPHHEVAVGDVNGDGHVDVVVPGIGGPCGFIGSTSMVGVLLGSGSGTFSPASGSPYATGITCLYEYGTNSAALGDFDGDGDLDAAVLRNSFGRVIELWANDGAGGFTAVGTLGPGTILGGSALAVGDVNADGLPDILTNSNRTGISPPGDAWVYYGTGGLSFAPASPIGSQEALDWQTSAGTSIGRGDLNGDGLPDSVQYDGGQFLTTLNSPAGFSNTTRYFLAAPSPGAEVFSTSMSLADMDGDGRLDAVGVIRQIRHDEFGVPIGDFDSGAWIIDGFIPVVFGDGAGGFTPPFFYPTTQPRTAVATGDIDGDGRQDIVATGNGGMTVLLSTAPPVADTTIEDVVAAIGGLNMPPGPWVTNLESKLSAAIWYRDRGDITTAVFMLNSVIDRVNGYVRYNMLTAALADPFIALAHEAIDTLTP